LQGPYQPRHAPRPAPAGPVDGRDVYSIADRRDAHR
jgi:hypothetical protein